MYIDLLLLFVVLLFVVIGYVQGFLRQLFSLIALITTLLFAHPLATWLKESSDWHWAEQAPVVALWGMSALLIYSFTMAVEGVVFLARKNPGIDPTDRWIGCAFGVVKGLVITIVLSTLFLLLPEKARSKFADLEHDSRKSFFLDASSSLLSWKSLSSIQGLSAIRNALDKNKSLFSRDDLNNEIRSTQKNPFTADEDDDSDTY